MSKRRAMTGGWADRKKIPRGPNGRGLCRWCSLEVPPRRFTFCSEYCVHEWKLRCHREATRRLRERLKSAVASL